MLVTFLAASQNVLFVSTLEFSEKKLPQCVEIKHLHLLSACVLGVDLVSLTLTDTILGNSAHLLSLTVVYSKLWL